MLRAGLYQRNGTNQRNGTIRPVAIAHKLNPSRLTSETGWVVCGLLGAGLF